MSTRAARATARRFSDRARARGYEINTRSEQMMHASTEARRAEIEEFLAWCYSYLPAHFYGEPAPFHRELAELFEDSDRVAVAAPRGHNKSTLTSLGYALYRCAKRRSRFVVILSDTGEQARDLVGAVYKELLENERLTTDYPHLSLPQPVHYKKQKVRRRQSDFITVGSIRFAARSRGAGLRGLKEGNQRPDLLICDDLENDEHVATPKQRAKTLNWFQKSVSNLFGAAGGKLIVVGTILHRQSLLATLVSEKGPSVYVKRTYKALANGVALWPGAWPTWKLEQKRAEIGSRAFATEYLNTPAADSATLFKEEWIRVSRVLKLPAHVTFSRIVVSVDPSGSEDGSGDACGIVVTALGTDMHAYVLEDLTLNGSPAAWGRAALDAMTRWQANSLVYESNYGGAMVKSVIKAELRPRERMPHMIGVTAKQGKSLRAEPVSVEYEKGRVHHVGHLPDLEDEQTEWIPGMASPNRLDALVYGVTELMLKGDLSLVPQTQEGW